MSDSSYPMGCSLPGSSVHEFFQAIVLEWIAISFSRDSSQPRDWTWVSCIVDRRFTFWATREVPGVWFSSYQWRDKIDLKVGGESKGLWGRIDLLTSVQQTRCVCWGWHVTGVTAEQIRVLQAVWDVAECKLCPRVWSLAPGIQEPHGFMEQASLLYQWDRPGSVCLFFY